MLIVWRLRENIIRTVSYCQWAQLTKRLIQPGYALSSSFVCSKLHDLSVYFVLPRSFESSPFTFWRWLNKLKWYPSSFLLPLHYCRLEAGSIPLRAIVNKKQCETRGLFMSLVIHCWIADVQSELFIFLSVLPLQWAQLTKTVHTARFGLVLVFLGYFRLHDLSVFLYDFFYLGHLSHFPSCCGAGVINLNVPPSSCLLPPRCCGLGAGSIPLRAIVNKKQCETRRLFNRWSSIILNRFPNT